MGVGAASGVEEGACFVGLVAWWLLLFRIEAEVVRLDSSGADHWCLVALMLIIGAWWH